MKFNVKSLLTDKVVLYIVLFFAVTNFFGYILLNNYNAVITMALVGLFASYFSKNMIIILFAAILGGSLVTGADTVNQGLHKRHREGMQNRKVKEEKVKKENKKKENKKKDKKIEEKEGFKKINTKKNSDSDDEDSDKEAFEPSSDLDSTERAINNLDNILGGGNINKLLEQQNALNSSVEGMKPLLNSASKLLDGIHNSNMIERLTTMSESMSNKMSNRKKQ